MLENKGKNGGAPVSHRPRGRLSIGMWDRLFDLMKVHAYSIIKRRAMDEIKCRAWLPRTCHCFFKADK